MYDAILAGIRSYTDFTARVRPGNFRDHTGNQPAKLKDSLQSADTPQVELKPTSGDWDLDATNTTTDGVQNFELSIVSGDLRLQANHFPLKFATGKALATLGPNLGLPFVTRVTMSDLVDDVNDFEESKGQQGWIGKITISVKFVIQKSTLLE